MNLGVTSAFPPAVSGAAVHLGGKALLGAVSDLAGSARTDVMADAFRVDHQPGIDSLGAAAARGAQVSVLADSREWRDANPQVAGGVHVQGYGEAPTKQHGKAITVDGGARGMVGTDLLGADALGKLEVGVELGGPAAQALRSLQVAARAGKHGDGMRQAAAAAAQLGVVTNDPAAGWWGVTDAIEHAVDSAQSRLRIVSAGMDDHGIADRIAQAARRGVDVDIVSYAADVKGKVARTLTDAGVHLHSADKDSLKAQGRGLHGLQLVADDHAVVSGAYLLEDMLHGSSGRQSRELGVVLDGAAAKTVADAVDGYF
ncbi:MAG: hypothetical protein JWM98_76 [Thermoleophilia bacterium]|nr:hypothetical protein [Thermoleophilia bacterium]